MLGQFGVKVTQNGPLDDGAYVAGRESSASLKLQRRVKQEEGRLRRTATAPAVLSLCLCPLVDDRSRSLHRFTIPLHVLFEVLFR
jgi:hypothetical protein